jgi:rhodanese-related sulfurtransferase
MNDRGYAGDVVPAEAWRILSEDSEAVLVDCRTTAEWAFVGLPDLGSLGKQTICVEWNRYPDMAMNGDFAQELDAAGVGPEQTVLFICRSGQRSRSAAIAMTSAGYQRCYNVAEGFEGNHDEARHRGTVGGWKVVPLPWVQG